MAAPTTPGLTPQEAAFLAENEMVDIIPRQRLDSLQLLSGTTPNLLPPQRASVPLWLAILLKRQQRANIVSPPWLTVDALTKILDHEAELAQEHDRDREAHGSLASPAPEFTQSDALSQSQPQRQTQNSTQDRRAPAVAFTHPTALPRPVYTASSVRSVPISPPFVISSTGNASARNLPYHWLEISQLLLDGASDDLQDADDVRRLVRDLRETRAAKMRILVKQLEGNKQAVLNGVSAMEVVEHRSFVVGVMDGLRKIGTSAEGNRRDREEAQRAAGGRRPAADDYSDDEMDL